MIHNAVTWTGHKSRPLAEDGEGFLYVRFNRYMVALMWIGCIYNDQLDLWGYGIRQNRFGFSAGVCYATEKWELRFSFGPWTWTPIKIAEERLYGRH